MTDYCFADYRRYKKGKENSGNTATYNSWLSMKRRCLCSDARNYHNYGGRGVTICQRWLDSFDSFYEDMGHCPEGKSLDKDILGDGLLYSPDTCMWATPKEQNRARRNNRLVTIDGETRCLAEWIEIRGLNAAAVKTRIYCYGYTPEEALAIPFVPKPVNQPRKSGLGFCKVGKKFVASFINNKTRTHLGTFDCPLLARLAYEREYFKQLGVLPLTPDIPQNIFVAA